MDRSWIELSGSDRFCKEYSDGVKSFIQFAVNSADSRNWIRCPCPVCNNVYLHSISIVEDHLFENGFISDYTVWIHHGETYDLNIDDGDNNDEHNDEESSLYANDGMQDMIENIYAGSLLRHPSEREVGSSEPILEGEVSEPIPEAEEIKFNRLLEDAKREAYPGCQNYSKIPCLVRLLHLKTMNNWTNKSWNQLIDFLKDLLPPGETLPKSYNEAKSMIRDLGLSYNKIHACKNDCILFRKEYSDLDLVSADTPGAIITKNVRGVARSLALKKSIRKNGGNKLPITYPEGKLKPVGMWASIFTSELGVLCRKGKYLEAKTWGAVPLSEKEKLYAAIKNSFEIEFSLNVLTGMESQLEILYKQWMFRMHKHYAKYPSMEVAIENPYGGVAKEHWENLCKDHFATEAFKKKSQTNQANRSKRKIHRLLGSRSYVNHRYMMRNKETNEELGPIEFWKEVHFDKGTDKWKCQRAKDHYDEMTQLQQMSLEEEGTPLTEKEIVERVLRNESGYMLGIGYGEMQHASSNSRKDYAAEYGRAQSRAEEAERRAEATERRAEAAERRVDHLGSELANVKETMEQFRSFMENIGSGLQLSPNRFQSDSPRTPRSTRRGRY